MARCSLPRTAHINVILRVDTIIDITVTLRNIDVVHANAVIIQVDSGHPLLPAVGAPRSQPTALAAEQCQMRPPMLEEEQAEKHISVNDSARLNGS